MSVFYRDMGSIGTYAGYGEERREMSIRDNKVIVCEYMANQLRVVSK